MKLTISKTKNACSLYVTKSIYVKGKHTSKVVEKLGTVAELTKKLDGRDPFEWAKEHIAELNRMEKENKRDIMVKYSPTKIINKDIQQSYNGGYLFLQKIYSELKLNEICHSLEQKHKFTFDMNAVLSRLLYARIIYPSSKLATFELSKKFIEQPNFELQHIYRALSVMATDNDYIQSSVYKNSLSIMKRNTGILYYDCTNYFFEIEQEAGLKQYGVSKEHRPNPIVQMGLFMDADGIPLSFNINKGNENEQTTMKPLEEKIINDFNCSKFIVCTDAGLASYDNRKYNNMQERAFITTQSIKKLKKHIMDWALSLEGWHLVGSNAIYNINNINTETDFDKVFYKERWINENGLEQKLIITYSIKYREYQKNIRASQVERAQKAVKTNPTKLKKCNQNDYKRFIKRTGVTLEGELANKEIYSIDKERITSEETFDGFYAVCTNLDDDVEGILKINKRRWEIEDCFRIMKSEFKARPVYLNRDDRIVAHFMTCFLSLIIFRFLEKKLGNKYTCSEIINGLRDINFFEIKGEGYIPTYTRTDFNDDLHEAFGFRTDYQIITKSTMKNIFSRTSC